MQTLCVIFFGACRLWGTGQDRNPNKQAPNVTELPPTWVQKLQWAGPYVTVVHTFNGTTQEAENSASKKKKNQEHNTTPMWLCQ